MADHRTLQLQCWHCDTPLDGHMNANDEENHAPEPGMVSACIYCGAWAFFALTHDGELTLRPPTNDEWVSFMQDVDVLRDAYALTRFREERGISVPEK